MEYDHFYQPMDPNHMYTYNNINHDKFTATFSPNFYSTYMVHSSSQCFVSLVGTQVRGYMIGKDEGSLSKDEYHVHVSAVTIAPASRKQKLAANLMHSLEQIGNLYKCSFCDLFVKQLNMGANQMYKNLGYTLFRTITRFYGNTEDGYDMRKPLQSDTTSQCINNSGSTIKKWIDYQW
ncbi:N-terminal acetyltransferase complex ARD1 subunit [Spironucleus salmonicida]|uniref:N-terminal acetyltransferase complex ARD1 subunit n=1 Tax=Spironucleus salmonicida TaxID=348837 RepID=V6LGB9_9EUKA|nr:N-terminal acetyltransferase complex ARD1 subunit [Spironucleus salmonicida]|eukprot:EST42716.1 N-terminal acetyltransferase complex ARD1 subunit [Spironucleus salmonicida]